MESSPSSSNATESTVFGWYEWVDSFSDERSRGLAMVDSVVPLVTALVLYIAMVVVGPKIMRARRPFELRGAMALYNLCMTLLSGYMAVELFVSYWRLLRRDTSQPSMSDAEEKRVIYGVWLFYCSKVIEFSDTLFFVLRKKDSQISFLHVYHHATVLAFWWVGVKWCPTFYNVVIASMANSFVHFWMYLYYGLASLGPALAPYLWWKRHLTTMQIVQFITAIGFATHALITESSVPMGLKVAILIYMVSFLVLFGHFYMKAYLQKNKGHELLCRPTAITLEQKAVQKKQRANIAFNFNGGLKAE